MNKSATSGRRVISNSIIYTLSGLLQKCFSLFLLPLYTAYLSTEDYGIISIANSFISTMSFIVAFSLFSSVVRYYVDLCSDANRLRRFYGTVVVFVWISSLIWGCVFVAARSILEKYVFKGVLFYPVILICIISLSFSCQHTIYENILRSQQKALKCSIISLSYFLVMVFLNITFVVFLKKGSTGVLLSTLITNAVFTLVFICDMHKGHAIKLCIDFSLLKEALKYSIPIIPHNLSTYIATLVSQVLIGNTSTIASVGVYSIAIQFGSIADTIQNYVNNAYAPWLYAKLNERDRKYQFEIRNVVKILCSVIGLLFICIVLFSQDYIVLFLAKSYRDSWQYVPWIVLVYGIKTIYYFYVNIMFYFKAASRLIFIATVTSSIANVLFSAVLIPKYGIFGSIFADAISMLMRVSLVVLMSKRFETIGLHIRDFVYSYIYIALFSFIGLVPSYARNQVEFSWLNLCWKVITVLLYIATQLMMNKQLAFKITNGIKTVVNKGRCKK